MDMEELRGLLRERCKKNNYMLLSHISMTEVDTDLAVFTMEVTEDNLNPNRTVHGGAFFTLADCTAGTAAHTDGRKYVTQTSSFTFLRTGRLGDTIRATAHVRRRGKNTCYAEVDITDSGGNLLCAGSFTFFCIADSYHY